MKKTARLKFSFRYLTRVTAAGTCAVLICVSWAKAQAPLISLENEKLRYTKYANRGQTNAVNQVPDFSHAGYRGGGVRIPDLVVSEVLEPVEGDCRALIQDAIDRVSALSPDASGHRGAVLLKAGIYPVEGSLFIRTGGVVLRGEGNGLEGTVLIATQKTQHNFIVVQGTGSGYGEVSGSRVKITTGYVPTGATTFEVAAGHGLMPGDNVVVQKTPTEAWIDALDMRQYGWTASGYRNTYERKIQAVQGNTITLDIPVVDPLEQVYGGGDIYKSNITGRVKECGVENMRIESFFVNHDDESHGWNAVVMNRSENCWVSNVVAKFFGYACVNVSNMSRFITVEDCAMIDPKSVTTGGRKYSFNIEGNSNGVLFQRCMTWGGRHDYVSGSRVPGPNVFLDCIAENTFADIGPHHRWATGQLYDNVYGGQIRVQNRGASGSGHGWSGAQTLFWNCYSFKSDIEVESPPTAMNWGIGCIGQKQTNSGYWESWGTHVMPRSLYLQQLRERLGTTAVQNIATADQLQGIIWTALREKANQIVAEPKVVYVDDPGSGSFDITDNGGSITAQYPNTSKPSENFYSLIDNSTSTKYYRSGRTALWIQYQSSVPAVVVNYTITSANDVPARDPKDWSLQASNDGSHWVTLDSRTNEIFASRFLTKTFAFENASPYIYYRLAITDNNGHSGTQFAEWELYERKNQTIAFGDIPEKTYGDEPFDFVVSASSGLPVVMEVVSGPATLAEGVITINGAGTVTVRVSQAGNENYFPVVADKTFFINKAPQSVTVEPIPPKSVNDAVALSAVATSGLPVSFQVVAGPGELTGNMLSFTGEGEVVIRVGQSGNENYLAAEPVTPTVLVYAGDEKRDGILLIVHPNPTKGKLKVKVENKKDKTYSFIIYNEQGHVVESTVIAKSHAMFDVGFDLGQDAEGIYYLRVYDGEEAFVRRIIKQ